MRVELSHELIEQIIFGMENQRDQMYLDLLKSTIILQAHVHPDEYDEKRFVTLPDWKPVQGFQLMEKYVENMRNPLVRQELKYALNSRQGVFRQFKDILKKYPKLIIRDKINNNLIEVRRFSYHEIFSYVL